MLLHSLGVLAAIQRDDLRSRRGIVRVVVVRTDGRPCIVHGDFDLGG